MVLCCVLRQIWSDTGRESRGRVIHLKPDQFLLSQIISSVMYMSNISFFRKYAPQKKVNDCGYLTSQDTILHYNKGKNKRREHTHNVIMCVTTIPHLHIWDNCPQTFFLVISLGHYPVVFCTITVYSGIHLSDFLKPEGCCPRCWKDFLFIYFFKKKFPRVKNCVELSCRPVVPNFFLKGRPDSSCGTCGNRRGGDKAGSGLGPGGCGHLLYVGKYFCQFHGFIS